MFGLVLLCAVMRHHRGSTPAAGLETRRGVCISAGPTNPRAVTCCNALIKFQQRSSREAMVTLSHVGYSRPECAARARHHPTARPALQGRTVPIPEQEEQRRRRAWLHCSGAQQGAVVLTFHQGPGQNI